MQRVLFFCLVMSLPLGWASAQVPKVPVELIAAYEVPELGMMFDYPQGWVTDTSSSLTLVANPKDLTAATDNDPATKAVEPFISLDLIALDGTGLPPNPRLESARDLVVNVLGLAIEEELEIPVMARRAITLYAADKNGDYGLITLWLQDGSLVLFVLSAPTAQDTANWLSVWKLILASVRPINALPLTQSAFSEFLQAEFQYPENWTIYNETDRLGIFEQPNDRDLYIIGNYTFFTGIVITALYQATDELLQTGILTEVSLDALLELNINFLSFSETQVGEAVFFGEPALTIKGVTGGGFYAYGVMGLVEDHAYFVLATSPKQSALDEFIPTFHAMMPTFEHR